MAHLDYNQANAEFKDRVLEGIRKHFPIEGKLQKVELEDLSVQEGERHADDIDGQHVAKVEGKTWSSPVVGTLVLKKADGTVLQKKRMKLADVPMLTRRHSYIIGGQEWQVDNQWQLKPGVYTRRKANGILESRFNVPNTREFDLSFDPGTKEFMLSRGKSKKIPVYPLIKALGVDDGQLERTWGKEILEANKKARGSESALERFYRADRKNPPASQKEALDYFKQKMQEAELRPEVTETTLGKPFSNVTGDTFLRATDKVLQVQSGAPEDDRDSLLFKDLRTAGDYVYDRLVSPAVSQRIRKRTVRKVNFANDLRDVVKSDLFNDHIKRSFSDNSAARIADQINPVEMLAASGQTTVMGQGGIKSQQAVDKMVSLKLINPSHLGFLDPVKTPEGSSTGVTLRMPVGVVKVGNEPRIPLYNTRTNKTELVNPSKFSKSTVALPDQVEWKDGKPKFIGPNIKVSGPSNEFTEARSKDVDYVMRHPSQLFNVTTNLIPFLNSNSGNRATYATQHIEQAISLKGRQAPLVQVSTGQTKPGISSWEDVIGRNTSHVAPTSGKVVRVDNKAVVVKDSKGKEHKVALYDNFPLNDKKSLLHSTPTVKVGDSVSKGQHIADTNYTQKGSLALGQNLKVAYIPYRGYNFEDGIVVSRSAAQKMASEHLHKPSMTITKDAVTDVKKFQIQHPEVFNRKQYELLDDSGVVRVGQKVKPGDPLVLSMRPFQLKGKMGIDPLRRVLSGAHSDTSLRWESDYPGEVVGVNRRPNGEVTVHVRTVEPLQVGDKLSNRAGGKGIVSLVLDDDRMPNTKDGPLDALLNPSGVPGRVNLGQVLETAASKIAEKTGKPYLVNNFDRASALDTVKRDLKKHGLSDQEEITDPVTGVNIGKALVGKQHMLKLTHQIDKKVSARSGMTLPGQTETEGYDTNLIPVGGGKAGGQSIGHLGLYSLLASGATANIREMQTWKSEGPDPQAKESNRWPSQHNAVWQAIQTGMPLPTPKPTFAFKKFTDYLKGSGINIEKKGHELQLTPLTDKQILSMSSGEIKKPHLTFSKIDPKTGELKVRPGGFFDEKITGGLGGKKWCFHPSTKILTDRGMVTIGDIVNKRLPVKVLSMRADGFLEWKKVVRYWKNRSPNRLIALNYESSGHLSGYSRRSSKVSVLWCTEGHEIYSEGRKVHATDMKGKLATLATHSLSSAQEQLMLGSLLGDAYMDGGSASKNWLFKCGHGPEQLEYLKLKVGMLSEFVDAKVHAQKKKKDGEWKERTTYVMRTIRHPVFTKIYSDTHKNGKKYVTEDWLNRIDERGLAFWYFDDGSIGRDGNKIQVTLCTHGFSWWEVILIQRWLHKRWGVKSSISRQSKYEDRPRGWVLQLSSNSARRLLGLIAPYTPECLRYKVDIKYSYGLCKKCSGDIDPNYDVCDGCVLKQVKKVKSRRAYQSSSERLLNESTIRQRYGSWSRAKRMASGVESVELVAEATDTFEELRYTVGTRLDELLESSSTAVCEVRIKGVDKSGTKEHSKDRTVYDLEVADNHNYFANGILVSNCHLKLPEPVPNPVFEGPIQKLTGLKGKDYSSIVTGKKAVSKTGQVVDIGTPGAASGGEGIKRLLDKIDVKKDLKRAEEELSKLTVPSSASDKATPKVDLLVKKVKYLRALDNAGMKPSEAYVLNNVPIMPPAVRTPAILNDGSVRYEDINKLYKDLGEQTSQLTPKLYGSMTEEMKQEFRASLYDGVSAIMGLGAPKKSSADDRGIMEQIAGTSPKKGFFQKQLLNRKQDLSMRATIVPEPALGLDEVGIPKDKALTLYQPFVVKKLQDLGAASNPLEAQKLIKDKDSMVFSALESVTKERPLLLKRDPALHKHSVQAFQPRLVGGKAIQVHPLVTGGFNADFDGDQMSAYVPISNEAVAEARNMLPSNNLYNEATGKVIHTPTLESALGLYKLSRVGNDSKRRFKTPGEAVKAVQQGKLGMTDLVNVAGVKTTPGRLLISSALPESMRPTVLTKYDETIDKKGLNKLFTTLAKDHKGEFGVYANRLKDLGNGASSGAIAVIDYKTGPSATAAAERPKEKRQYVPMPVHTLTLDDFQPDYSVRNKYLNKAQSFVNSLNKGRLPWQKKDVKTIQAWSEASKKMTDEHIRKMVKKPSNLAIMALAGTKPSIDQYRQMVLAPMVMTDASGAPIKNPVKESYAEGLDVASYWTQMHGARAGSIKKVQEVRDPGYLSKQLMQTSMSQVVADEDCGTQRGIAMSVGSADLNDRVLAKDFNARGVAIPKDTIVTPSVLDRMRSADKNASVLVRSTLKCEHEKGVCQKCAGLGPDGRFYDKGSNIGVLAAQSLGERSVQLTLKSFHSGGVKSTGSTNLLSGLNRIEQLTRLPKRIPDSATLSQRSGVIEKVEDDPTGAKIWIGGKVHHVGKDRYGVPLYKPLPHVEKGAILKSWTPPRPGMKVEAGQSLTDPNRTFVNPRDLYRATGNMEKVQNFLADELYDIYRPEGVRRQHVETVVRAMGQATKIQDSGDAPVLKGDYQNAAKVRALNNQLSKAGKRPIAHSPILRGINVLPLQVQEDWMAKLQHEKLQGTILDAAATGAVSNIHGVHPIPGAVYGAEFGRTKRHSLKPGLLHLKDVPEYGY